jgi:hypothetical protein
MVPAILVATLFIFGTMSNAHANLSKYSLQAGAWGDDASQRNLGVRAEIRTHIYSADNGTFDYFWVGDNLANGAFIQFGYGYEPGNDCLKMHEVNNTGICNGKLDRVGNSDARWEWQYWPNGRTNDFYYGKGPANSAGANGTWHTYAIVPGQGRWSFLLDNQTVDSISAKPEQSSDPVYVVAEKSINTKHFGKLGPVEFRGVAYLSDDGWHDVDSLLSLHGCAALSDCGVENPYGAVAVGPDHIIAGSGVAIMGSQNLLWTDSYVTLKVTEHPNAAGLMTILRNTTTFQGSFSLEVPKGMFVYINLDRSRVPAASPWNLLGASSDFRGWSGDINSTSGSISVLMDGNKTINGSWTTDYSNPTIAITIMILLGACLAYLVMRMRRKNPRE